MLWYVFGIHHITRPEDWPVMPADVVSFWLKPFGFFDRNPALDVPPNMPKHGATCHSMRVDSNAAVRWRMPAEWETHERCLMAWPTRADLWDAYFEEAKREFAATANAIVRFEPLTLIVNPGQVDDARRLVSDAVEIVEIPIDDSWVRDSGPIGVVSSDGRRAGVDFRFNSWGERFLPYDQDAASGEAILEALEIERITSEMVLEGGSLTVDGEGTLITTEQCLLNKNRNPGLTREEIEAELKRCLGVEKIIWLRHGHVEDTHTDGHVDAVCTYVRPGVVVAQTCEDPGNPNYRLMAENLEILRSETDAAGRPVRGGRAAALALLRSRRRRADGQLRQLLRRKRRRRRADRRPPHGRRGARDHRLRLPGSRGRRCPRPHHLLRRRRAPLHHAAGSVAGVAS